MARKQKHEEHVNHERWLVNYADFITLLFATFTALYAISNADMDKFRKLQASIKMAFAEGPSCVMKGTPVDSSVQAKGGADPQGNLVISIFSPDYSSNQGGEMRTKTEWEMGMKMALATARRRERKTRSMES